MFDVKWVQRQRHPRYNHQVLDRQKARLLNNYFFVIAKGVIFKKSFPTGVEVCVSGEDVILHDIVAKQVILRIRLVEET